MTELDRRIAGLSPQARAVLLQRLNQQRPPAAPAAGAGTGAGLPRIVPRPAERYEPFPLTEIQEAYWTGRNASFDLSACGTNVYLENDFAGVPDGIFVARFQAALERLVRHHDVLRTVFAGPDGEQRVLSSVPPCRVPVVDLRQAGPEACEREMERLRRWLRGRKAPLDRWPLFDFVLFRLPGSRVRLQGRIESLLIDGRSRAMLFRELARLLQDPEAPLHPRACSYRDFVLTWNAFRDSEAWRRSRDYWLGRVASLPPAPELPLAAPLAPDTPIRFANRRVTLLDAGDWARLKERSGRIGLTPSGVLAAAFAEVLAVWSETPRFTLSVEGTHRPEMHPEIHEVMGNFNTILLLEVPEPAPTFEERAARLRDRMAADLDHWHFSGLRVLREMNRLHGGCSRAAMPVLFDSVVEYSHASYVPAAPAAAGAPPALSWELVEVDLGAYIPQILLVPVLYEAEGALGCKWQSVDSAFPPGLMDDLLAAFRGTLHRLATREESWQAAPGVLVPRPQPPEVAGPQAVAVTLHGLFERQAGRAPHHPAVVAPRRTLTYGELGRLSRALARRLRERGAGPGTRIATAVPPGWELVVARLAVLQAGAAFVLDPAAHAGARLTVTRADLDAVEGAEDGPLAPAARPEDLAYVDSRGVAGVAGVAVEHRGAASAFLDVHERFAVGPDDRLLAVAPPGSDLSVYDTLGVLTAGATLVLPASPGPDGATWARDVKRHGVTLWHGPAPWFERLVRHAEEADPGALASLRLALLPRAPVPGTLPRRAAALTGARLVALGGSSETGVWAFLEANDGLVPLAGRRLRVLDDRGDRRAPRPAWVPGDLWVTGEGIAPVRTGERARLRPGGTVEPLGPPAVRIRGRSVRPAEIEAALGHHPDVRLAAVRVDESDRGPRLTAFVAPLRGSSLDVSLPRPLRPHRIVLLPELPLTPEGLVDREALPYPAGPAAVPAPLTTLLETGLADLWQEVLGVRPAGLDDDFFAMGGDSLTAVRLFERLRDRYGIEPVLPDFFFDPTIRHLAQRLSLENTE